MWFKVVCHDSLNFNLLVKGKMILGIHVAADGITGTSGSVPVKKATSMLYLADPSQSLFNLSTGIMREAGLVMAIYLYQYRHICIFLKIDSQIPIPIYRYYIRHLGVRMKIRYCSKSLSQVPKNFH